MESRKSHNTATALRRQKQIEDCLYNSMLTVPYQSISVSDICRQVGISRKAFYNYYRDKDACFSSAVDRFIHDGLLYAVQNTPDDATPLEAAVIMLEYWKTKKEFLDVILRNNLLHFLFIQNMNYVLNEERATLEQLSTPSLKSDTDILACYMSSQLMLVLRWYLRGFDSPTEEIAKKLLRILCEPLIAPPAP